MGLGDVAGGMKHKGAKEGTGGLEMIGERELITGGGVPREGRA